MHRLYLRSQAAAYDDAAATLFLADANGRASKLTALDPLTSAIRWETPAKALNVCGGVAALPSLGLVAVSSACSNRVHILRVSDGTPVAHFSCKVSSGYGRGPPSTPRHSGTPSVLTGTGLPRGLGRRERGYNCVCVVPKSLGDVVHGRGLPRPCKPRCAGPDRYLERRRRAPCAHASP